MKTRILSALVGLLILAVVLVLYDTLVLNITIGAICILAVKELLQAARCTKHRGLVAASLAMTLLIPFVRWARLHSIVLEVFFVLVLVFFLLTLSGKEAVGVEQMAMAFFFSTIIPAFFSCAVYMRDDFGAVRGIFYMLLALGAAWLCDTCAYFVGIRYGRHKLAPRISPKKTVEGAIGGVVLGTVLMLLLGFGYSVVLSMLGFSVQIEYWLLALCTPVISVLGMLGDLCASMIKRRFGVKDYGQIMPGHGGILDRFDSVMFTLPTVYILAHHVAFIKIG